METKLHMVIVALEKSLGDRRAEIYIPGAGDRNTYRPEEGEQIQDAARPLTVCDGFATDGTPIPIRGTYRRTANGGEDMVTDDGTRHVLGPCAQIERATDAATQKPGGFSPRTEPTAPERASFDAPERPETPPTAHGTYEDGGVFPHEP
jgi:hypothetical protein